jgi:hypothetical protein
LWLEEADIEIGELLRKLMDPSLVRRPGALLRWAMLPEERRFGDDEAPCLMIQTV